MDILFVSFEGTCHLIIHGIFKHKPKHEYKHARESVQKLSNKYDLSEIKSKTKNKPDYVFVRTHISVVVKAGCNLKTRMPARNDQSAKGTEMTDSIRNSSKKNLNLYKTFTRRTLDGIMDGFIREVNQKINLLDDACPDFAFLKHGFLKTRSIKRFQICYVVLYSAMKFHLMF